MNKVAKLKTVIHFLFFFQSYFKVNYFFLTVLPNFASSNINILLNCMISIHESIFEVNAGIFLTRLLLKCIIHTQTGNEQLSSFPDFKTSL